MRLTDDVLLAWDKRSLRVPRDEHARLKRELVGLIATWRSCAQGSSPFDIVRFRLVGSLQKTTALRPRTRTELDADVAVYLDSSRVSDYDLRMVHATLRALVRGARPRLSDADFCVQPHTLGVQFSEPRVLVDLVPMIVSDDEVERGRMLSWNGGPGAKTNIPEHIAFVETLAAVDPCYRVLVRMVKTWRNYADLRRALSSFAIELLLAHLLYERGPAPTIEQGLQRFFLYLAQRRLEDPVLLGHDVTPRDGHVIVMDPANSENNVTARMLESERLEIVEAATAAWETLMTAHHSSRREMTLSLWAEVFGPRFATAGWVRRPEEALR